MSQNYSCSIEFIYCKMCGVHDQMVKYSINLWKYVSIGSVWFIIQHFIILMYKSIYSNKVKYRWLYKQMCKNVIFSVCVFDTVLNSSKLLDKRYFKQQFIYVDFLGDYN